MPRILSALSRIALLLVATQLLSACAIWGVAEDKRLSDTMRDDKALATSIKSAIMQEKFSDGWSVSVYSYYRKVFMVGEVPGTMQSRAVEIAKSKKPRSVTTHWFTKSKNDSSNIGLATRLRGALIGTKGLSSTRIDTEVNAGRVILLGVVDSEQEKDLAVKTAQGVEGVTNVTSYLMLPLGQARLGREDVAGNAPASGSSSGKSGSSGSSGNSGSSGGGIESRDI